MNTLSTRVPFTPAPFGLSLSKPSHFPFGLSLPFDKLRTIGISTPFGLSLSKPSRDPASEPFDKLRANGWEVDPA